MAMWSGTIGWGIAGGIIMLHFIIVNGNVHKSVNKLCGPIKISFPSYHTSTLSIWNTTMHPALQNGWIPKREAIARFGMMCRTNGLGRPGTTTLHVCVDFTCCPSGRFTVNGFLAGCLFTTGIPYCTKTDVAPVSAMPWDTSILMCCMRRTNPATSVVGGWDETFNVTTIALLSSALLHTRLMVVGSRGAETKILNLYAA